MKRNLLFNQATALGKRLAMVLTMLVMLGVTQAWGETIEISCPTLQCKTTATEISAGAPVTYMFSGSSNTYNPLRWYSGVNLTIKANDGYSITGIIITASGSYSLSNINIQSGGGNISNGVWTGESQTVVLQHKTSNSAQTRITKIAVTYTASSGGGDSGDDNTGGGGDCNVWKLVTDASDLKAGDQIVIAAKNVDKAMGKNSDNENNRTAVDITKNNNTITFGNQVKTITLGAGKKENTFAFEVDGNYLYAASSTSNHLKTKSTLDDNGSWTIAIASDGVATIEAQGTNTRNTMQYNNGSTLFACYASASQSPVCIYKYVECTTETTYSVTYNNNGATSGSVPVDNTKYAKDAQVTVLGNTGNLAKTGYTFSGWNTEANGTGTTTYAEGDKFTITKDTTLYAKWTANTYIITLDANGGTFVDKRDSQTKGSATFDYIYGTYATYSDAPNLTEYYTDLKRDGYQFAGWVSGGSPWNKLFTSTGDRTIQAQWSKLYSITLSENGTTTELDAQTSTSYTLPTKLSAGSCLDDTKELVGWSTVAIPNPGDKPTSKFYELGETVTLTADQTTFYAVFATAEGGGETAELVKMTADDDFNIGDKIVIIAEGEQYGLYQKTTTSNYIDYWTTEDKDGVPTLAEIEEDSKKYVEVSAGTATGTIKLGDATNGYLYNSSSTSMLISTENSSNWSIIAWDDDTFTFKAGQYLSCRTDLNDNTNKWRGAGSSCDCETGDNCSGVIYYNVYKYISGSTISYSEYTTTCDATKATITYNLNGGTEATCDPQTVMKGEEFDLCDQTPTKEGYTFAGWTDGVNTYAAGATVTVNERTTFYAKWNAKTITITWDQNYTDCPEAATSTYIYDGEEIAMPAEPIRTGYKFTGWFNAATDGTQVTEVGETNKPTTDVTYYAHWAQLYTVTFMASGQVYVVQEHKYLSGETLELPADPSAANYACDGYIFDGWSVAEKTEDATKPELISNPTITNDETYYAVWKKATIAGAGETILFANFDDNNGTGGNDGKWNDNIATASIQLPANWNHAYGYGANQCIKLGTGDKKGSVTTPALSQLSGNATLSFKAAAWNGSSESTTLVLSIAGGGSLSKNSVTLTKSAWQSYEVAITGGTSSTRITFAGKNTSNSRFFLDEVKVTTSGSYNYTTSPSCGPTIVAKDGMWVTSANSQSVKVNVPIAIKSFTTNATITGTTANTNFAVTTLENTGNGEHNLVVTYTPNASNIKEDATITLTAKVGEETISTTTFTLNGRSLPDQFAIVVDKASEYYALPANMPSEGTYTGFGVEVNAGTATAAPKTHLYTARAVHSTRFTENGTALRLVGNNDACLWASTAKDGTSIRNYANISNATNSQYEWNLYTEDGDTYRISCTAVTEEGRILRMYGANFGMYKSGAEVFYLLPVECTSTPTNIQVSPARVSATISWENAATCNLQVLKEGTPVQTIPGAVSPKVVTGLEELTAYTFRLTPTDAANCKVDGAFTTTGPDIDIVEWMTDGMIIQVDKDDAVDPSVVINGEVEYNTGSGAVATELFFSKYFEAHGENKLLAIYNGTGAPIDLSGYEIKSENGALDLSQFGQTEGKVAPNEEIILVYYDVNYSAEECAEQQEGYENWNILTKKSVLAFSGRGSIGLYKDDVLIDVIGSTFPSGELTKIGKSGKPDYCGTEGDVRLYVDGFSVNDESSFFCYDGDNIKTDEVENNYAISTNRCLLIRKNTVTSGANAVATNKADAGATCGNLSSTFTTLCSEWSGFRIGSGKSSSDEIEDATCDGLGYVGGFDYSKYYREYQPIGDTTTLRDLEYKANENLYKIPIDPLSNYSCLNVSVELRDPETDELLTQQVAQVPIIVASENTTTDELFSNIIADDLDASKTRCSTCDVVILKNATLTKAAVDTENDVNQVRNIYIYPGGKLVVPAEGYDYSINSLSLRRVEDEVSMASVQTPLLITSSAANPIYVDVRVNSENWHWFTLPHNCNIADVTWSDGTPAKYGTDWFLMWYDGESRAASTNPRDNHWKKYNGSTIEAGKGYIVGITGHPTKSKVKYELRFPMVKTVLTNEQDDKTVPVNAWGVKQDIRPNNKGWNLVGNPYLDYYKPASTGYTLGGLPLIEYADTYDPITGLWDYEVSGSVPFLVIPRDGGMSEYKQVLASEEDMLPFTAYFVQVGDPGTHTNGQVLQANFDPSKRGRASLIRRAPNEVDEQEEPAIVAVELTNSKGESDKTTLLIADRFTDEYEMNADFFKWFGDYYTYYTKPVLYTLGADNESRAFNALNEQLAAQPVALGMYAAQAGNYTFSLNQRSNLTGVAEVWLHDANSNTHTNLMQDDYSFSTTKTNGAGRFSLSVKMASKVTTAVDNITANGIWATTQDNQIVINGLTKDLQVWIYDATGKLLHADHTTNYQHSYSVPTSGVYFVRVNGKTEAQTIKVVVE